MHLGDYTITQAPRSLPVQMRSSSNSFAKSSLVCNWRNAAGTKSEVKYVQACIDEKKKLPNFRASGSLV